MRSRHGQLRQLERDIAGVPHHYRPDLDQLLAKRRQRLVLHRPRQRQPSQEVAKLVRKHTQLQAHLIVVDAAARQPCRSDRVQNIF